MVNYEKIERVSLTKEEMQDICCSCVSHALLNIDKVMDSWITGDVFKAEEFNNDMAKFVGAKFDSYYKKQNDGTQNNNVLSIKELKFQKQDAVDVIGYLFDILEAGHRYPLVRDVYDTLGIIMPCRYYGKGWTELTKVGLIHNADGTYSLDVPEPCPVHDRLKYGVTENYTKVNSNKFETAQ